MPVDARYDPVTDDRAGRLYWDQAWESEDFPEDVDPRSPRIWAHRDQLFHAVFHTVLQGMPHPKLLELGCARSAWLPYFAREFGASVAGLDYSPLGARQAAQRLQQSGIEGEVRCADLFAPPEDWRNAFDVVTWFGVAEHFDDATHAVRSAAAFLKPGGLLITEIPNLSGVNGWLQRMCNKAIYEIHVPHDLKSLVSHHRAAGLEIALARYVVPIDFGVVEVGARPATLSHAVKQQVMYALRLLSGVVWMLDRRVPLPATKTLGGFVIVAARKPA